MMISGKRTVIRQNSEKRSTEGATRNIGGISQVNNRAEGICFLFFFYLKFYLLIKVEIKYDNNK